MSRSYKKEPYSYYVGGSHFGKKNKKLANKVFRRTCKRLLKENPESLLYKVQEVYDKEDEDFPYYNEYLVQLSKSTDLEDKAWYKKEISK